MATDDHYCDKADKKRSRTRCSRVPHAKYGLVCRTTPIDKLPSNGKRADDLLFDDGMGGLSRSNVNVEFSLNKKGRFRLLDAVRGPGIVKLNNDESDQPQVDAVELVYRPDKLRGPYNRYVGPRVVGYHAVDAEGGEIHRVPSSKKTFSQDLKPTTPKPPKKQRKKKVATFRRHHNDGDEAVDDAAEQRQQLTYEFFLPNTLPSLAARCKRDFHSPARYKRRHRHDDFLGREHDLHESTDDEERANVRESALWRYEEPMPRVVEANIIDFLVPAISRIEHHQQRRRKKSSMMATAARSSKSSSTLSSDSFEDILDEDAETDYDMPTTSSSESAAAEEPPLRYFEMPAVEATILTMDLESERLQTDYGDKYYECACIPRRICINISTAVRNVMLVAHGPDFVHCVEQLQVLCVIEVEPPLNLDEDDELLSFNGDQLSFCRLWLNGNFEAEAQLELRMLDVLEDYSIDEILSSAAKMVGTMPREYFKLNPKAQRTYSRLLSASALAAASSSSEKSILRSCSPYADIHHAVGSMEMEKAATTALVEMKQTQRVQRQITAVQKFMEWRSMSVSMHVCDICCTDDDDTWALAACHHWFCKQCWLDYLCTQIRKGSHLILCPEYDCKAVLNYDLLCTVVPLPLCWTYANVVREQYIQSHHNEMTWCENPKCNRVVCFRKPSTRDQDGVVLSCDACGFTWCSGCKGEPHWPATCDQSELYISKLRQHGDDKPHHDDGDKIATVRVKPCPHCHRRMEKGEGCNHMTCRCGSAFCWECLGDWNGSHYQCKAEKNNFEKVRLIDVGPRGQIMRDDWYTKCVAHHQRLFTTSLRTLEQLFHRGIARFSRKMPGKKVALVGATTQPVVLDRIADTANRLLTAYKQAHYILEFTFVWVYFAQDLDRRHRCRIADLAQRLEFAVSRLEQSCINGEGERMRVFVPVVRELFSGLVTSINVAKR